MRIAILSEFVHPFHKGGAERRYYEIASRLAARGHDVHWFAMRHWPRGATEDLDGIHLHAAREPLDVYAKGGGRSVSAGMRVAWALTNSLRRAPVAFDVIDCSAYPFFHVFGARAVRPKTALVVSWYEYWGDHWYEYLGARGFFGKRVERLAASIPDRIISVSELATSSLLHVGVSPERVVTVPPGVDTAWIDAVQPSPEHSDIVFFGRLKNHKNVDLLLRALTFVKRDLRGTTCTVIGDGPERARLERLTDALQLSDDVRFLGEVRDEEVIARVKASRLFVHPSTKEGGASIALLEASACGVPAIAIDHPLGLDPSLIEQGRNGWWVPTAEPEALAAMITDALGDRARLERMRESSRSFARRFGWDRIVDACEAVYRQAIEVRV